MKCSCLHVDDLDLPLGPASISKVCSSSWPVARYAVMTGVFPVQPEGLMKEAVSPSITYDKRGADTFVSLIGAIVGVDVAASHWANQIARTDRSIRVPDHAALFTQILVTEFLAPASSVEIFTAAGPPDKALPGRVQPAVAFGIAHPPFLRVYTANLKGTQGATFTTP